MKVNFGFSVLSIIIVSMVCSCTQKEENMASEPEVESTWITLFNGKDLTGWYTWQKQPEPTSEVSGMEKDGEGNYIDPIGKNSDPLNVFTVVEEEGEPAIRISGEVFGILVTENEYENFHLKLQFKWGDEKFPPRVDKKMDSGILYHSIGLEGAWGGVWMKSLECQVQESDCGDYISVDTVMVEVPAIKNEEDGRYYHKPGAEMLTFDPGRSYCNKEADFENPKGEWNTMEIYTVDGNSVHVVNGTVNNRIYNARYLENGQETPLVKGKIQLQSEGAEIFYRNIQLMPIEALPDEVK